MNGVTGEGTFEDLLVESPLVRAEMARLRDLHGVYEQALLLALTEHMTRVSRTTGVEKPKHAAVVAEMEHYLGRARTLVGGAVPAVGNPG